MAALCSLVGNSSIRDRLSRTTSTLPHWSTGQNPSSNASQNKSIFFLFYAWHVRDLYLSTAHCLKKKAKCETKVFFSYANKSNFHFSEHATTVGRGQGEKLSPWNILSKNYRNAPVTKTFSTSVPVHLFINATHASCRHNLCVRNRKMMASCIFLCLYYA